MHNEIASTADRDLQLTRILNAPVELAWETFITPGHIAHWWGPDGFTISIDKMDVRPKGEWNLIMHGPDGTNYENRIIYSEVVMHKKIVLEYQTTPKHITTVEFETEENQTRMTWHMTFESSEQKTQLVRDFKVDKGLEQNVERWNRYLLILQKTGS